MCAAANCFRDQVGEDDDGIAVARKSRSLVMRLSALSTAIALMTHTAPGECRAFGDDRVPKNRTMPPGASAVTSPAKRAGKSKFVAGRPWTERCDAPLSSVLVRVHLRDSPAGVLGGPG